MSNQLTIKQLNKLNTKRLKALYKSVRKSFYHAEFDNNMGYTSDENLKIESEYKDLVKSVLDQREHID